MIGSTKHDSLVSSIQENYSTLTAEMDSIVYGLDRLYDNVILHEDGWRCHLAIDFHQLFDFAFPADRLLKRYKDQLPNDALIKAAAYNYTKQRCVFALQPAYGWPVLLPPFLSELHSMLVWRTQLSSSDSKLATLMALDGNKAFSPQERAEFKTLGDEARRAGDGPVSSKVIRDAANLLLDHISEVSLLTMTRSTNSYKRLSALFEEGAAVRVLTVNDNWPNYSRAIADSALTDHAATDTFQMLKELRPRWDANYRDAMAVNLVTLINRLFAGDGRREYIVLLSDARSMSAVLNWDLMLAGQLKQIEQWTNEHRSRGVLELPASPVPLEVRLLTNTDTLLFHHLLRGEQQWPSLMRVKDEINKLANYKLMKKTVRIQVDAKGQPDLNGFSDEQLTEIKNTMDEYDEFLRDLKTVRIAKSMEGRLSEEVEEMIRSAVSSFEKSVIDVVKIIEKERGDFASLVRDREVNLEHAIGDVENKITRLALHSPRRRLRLGTRMMYYNIVPYGFEFKDRKIQTLIEQLRPKFVRDSPGQVRAVTHELLELVTPSGRDEEHMLLLGIVLMAFGEYGAVVYALDDDEPWDDEGREFSRRYLVALAWHRKGLLRRSRFCRTRALSRGQQLITKYPENCRGYYLVGLMWIHWAEDGVVDRAEGVEKSITFGTRAVEIAHNEVTVPPGLLINMHNNLVWAKYVNDLDGRCKYTDEEFNDHLTTMSRHLEEWTPYHDDTAMVVFDHLASRTDNKLAAAKWRQLADEHARSLETNMDVFDVPNPDKAQMRQNLNKRKLNALHSKA